MNLIRFGWLLSAIEISNHFSLASRVQSSISNFRNSSTSFIRSVLFWMHLQLQAKDSSKYLLVRSIHSLNSSADTSQSVCLSLKSKWNFFDIRIRHLWLNWWANICLISGFWFVLIAGWGTHFTCRTLSRIACRHFGVSALCWCYAYVHVRVRLNLALHFL